MWGLGALGHLLLTGSAPGSAPGQSLETLAPRAPLPLVQALEAALAFDATTRPGATDLAVALLAACLALPIEGIVAAADLVPEDRRPLAGMATGLAALRVGVPPGRLLVGAAGLAALALVIGVGWVWGQQIADRLALVQEAGPGSPLRPFGPVVPPAPTTQPGSSAAAAVGATSWSEVL